MDELLGLVTAKAQEWLGSSFDEKTREEVKALMAKEDKSDLRRRYQPYEHLHRGYGYPGPGQLSEQELQGA